MVDQERGTYRPRRALIEPDHSTEEPVANGFSGSNGASGKPHGERGSSREDNGSDWAGSRQSIFAGLDDDLAPPLYRDGSSAPSSSGEPDGTSTELEDTDPRDGIADSGRQTWVGSALAGAAQRPVTRDEEETTALPRTSSGSSMTHGWQDAIDDFDDLDDDRPGIDRRIKLGFIIAGVAAVVVIGVLVIVAAVRGGGGQTVLPNPDPTGGPSSSASVQPTQQPVLLDDNSMIKPGDAKQVVPDRVWKVFSTQRGIAPDSAQPACLGGDPVEGEPAAAQAVIRLLTANGTQPPGILHEARAFTSPAEATHAFRIAAQRLGGCSEPGGYVRSGWSVAGLGDQALGVIVSIEKDGSTEYRSLVLSRTGTVVNVADVAKVGEPIHIGRLANALAAAIGVQCRAAAGACPDAVSAKVGTPPLGGDEPGFLATGDLPPVGDVASLWVGDAPDVPHDEFVGAQCENMNWSKTPANSRIARTYLLEQGADPGFGLDEIVLTMKSEQAAADFVAQLRKTVANCPDRKLTATVSKPASVTGIGAKGTKIEGWTATVSQKVSNGSLKYRVGAVTAGPKVVYTFLSPKGKLDLTDSEWKNLAVRAGQRATQVNK